MKYKAFISYKHDLYSRPFAEALEDALKIYGKPVLQRPFGIFRDEKIAKPGDDLPAVIKEGLTGSEFLIYLASRQAALAPWVRDEIVYWFDELEHKGKLIIVVIEEHVRFTGAGAAAVIDWEASPILPNILRDRCAANPLVAELSWAQKETDRTLDNPDFRKEINAISAALNGVEPGEMTDKAVIQYRRNRRLRNGVIAALITLLLTALVLAGVSYYQRQTAIRNKSSALSFLAQSLLPRNPTVAFLVGVEALLQNLNNEDAATAIRSAYYAGPFYNAFALHSGTINDLACSPRTGQIISAADDHSVTISDPDGHVRRRLTDHQYRVFRLAWSLDGRYFATGDNQGQVFLYDASGRLLQHFHHHDLIEGIQFSADSRYLLSVSRDATAVVWTIGHKEKVTLAHNNRAFSANFSPDGHRVLTAGGDSGAFIWDRQGKPLHRLARHKGPVVSAVYSHQGAWILTAGFDNRVMLWDSSGRYIRQWNGIRNVSTVLRFSPDDERLMFAGWGGKLYLYAFKGSQLKTIDKNSGEIITADFSGDGRYLAFAGKDAVIHLYSASGDFLLDLKGPVQDINKVVFTADSRFLVAGGADGSLFEWEMRNVLPDVYHASPGELLFLSQAHNRRCMVTGDNRGQLLVWDGYKKILLSKKLHRNVIYNAIFSHDDKYILTAGMDHRAALWNLKDTSALVYLAHSADVIDADFSPYNNQVVTAGYDSVARIWNMEGKPLFTLNGHGDRLLSVKFAPNGDSLVTTSRDHSAIIWDKDGRRLNTLPHPGPVSNVHFSPSGDRFVTTCRNSSLFVWKSNGQRLFVLHCPPGEIFYYAVFSPNEQRIAGSTDGNQILLWDRGGRPQAVLAGHTGMISDVTFSKDGRYVLTASIDATARLWTIEGKLLQVFTGHSEPVKSAQFSADESEVITVSYDGTLRVWPIKPDLIIHRIGDSYRHGIYRLTKEEKARFGVE